MHTNKLILCGALLVSLNVTQAQTSSLYFQHLYEAQNQKPVLAAPAWDEFSINADGVKTSLNGEGGLSVKIPSGSAFGYFLPLSAAGSVTLPYSVEYGLQSLRAGTSMDLDMCTPTGEQVSFTLQKERLINRVTGDTIVRNADFSGKSAFRFAVGQDQHTKIYRNGQLLSSQPNSRRDVIADPGFENSGKIDPMWWFSSWSQLTIDGNSPYKGSKSLHWENGWTGQLGALIPIQPNSKYRLVYWAKAVKVNASQSSMKGVLRVGGVHKANVDIPAGNYQKFTVEFVSGSTDALAELEFHNGWNNSDAGAFAVYIDDMELTRLEYTPYLKMGKMTTTGESDFVLRYVALSSPETGVPPVWADFSALLLQAGTLYEGAVEGSETGNYPAYAMERLSAELVHARSLEESVSDYFQMDAAYARLLSELRYFEASRITDPDLAFSVLQFSSLADTIRMADRVQLQPSGTMSDGEPIDPDLLLLTYTTLQKRVSVTPDGLLTALEEGLDTLVVEAHYKNAVTNLAIPLVITYYGIQSLSISTYAPVLRVGDASGIRALALMTGGQPAARGEVAFSHEVLTPALAQITPGGALLAKAPGTAVIKTVATFWDEEVTEETEVQLITVDRVELQLPVSLHAGTSDQYQLKAYYTDGTEIPAGREDVVILSSDRSTARVTNKGIVEAVRKGEAQITARVRQATYSKSVTAQIITESPVSIPSTLAEGNGVVYSAPGQKSVFVSIPSGASFTTLSLLSAQGEELYTQSVSTDCVELNLSNFPAAVYFVRLKGNQGESVYKFILE